MKRISLFKLLLFAPVAWGDPGALVLDRSPDRAKSIAEKALNTPPLSVTQKSALAPSGDRNDYMSLAPYWWPDPRKPDGLPYVRKDGERNPESASGTHTDHDRFQVLAEAVGDLAVGYLRSGDERFADHAGMLLRIWFNNPETRMNPHLDYAQSVPGKFEGRMYGIIDFHRIPEVVHAAGIIATSGAWSSTDEKRFREWCGGYLTWLRESPHGRGENNTKNNHGSWYDLQCLSLALYLEDSALAKEIAGDVAEKRIRPHIASDGSQPEELSRTRSFDYSIFNLRALALLARMAEQTGENLWEVETTGGEPALRKALEYLEKQVDAGWSHEQIKPVNRKKLEALRSLFPSAQATE